MALADIIKRIDRDTESEADAIIVAAQTEADRLRSAAKRSAAERRHMEIERVEHEVGEEARTRIAAARLRGRDRIIAEKRAFLDRVVREAITRVEALPDDAYAAFIAREVAVMARGGERLEIGRADADRLATALPAALVQAGVDVTVAGATDATERGAIIRGDRMIVEVSVAFVAHARRDALESVATDSLFGDGE